MNAESERNQMTKRRWNSKGSDQITFSTGRTAGAKIRKLKYSEKDIEERSRMEFSEPAVKNGFQFKNITFSDPDPIVGQAITTVNDEKSESGSDLNSQHVCHPEHSDPKLCVDFLPLIRKQICKLKKSNSSENLMAKEKNEPVFITTKSGFTYKKISFSNSITGPNISERGLDSSTVNRTRQVQPAEISPSKARPTETNEPLLCTTHSGFTFKKIVYSEEPSADTITSKRGITPSAENGVCRLSKADGSASQPKGQTNAPVMCTTPSGFTYRKIIYSEPSDAVSSEKSSQASEDDAHSKNSEAESVSVNSSKDAQSPVKIGSSVQRKSFSDTDQNSPKKKRYQPAAKSGFNDNSLSEGTNNSTIKTDIKSQKNFNPVSKVKTTKKEVVVNPLRNWMKPSMRMHTTSKVIEPNSPDKRTSDSVNKPLETSERVTKKSGFTYQKITF